MNEEEILAEKIRTELTAVRPMLLAHGGDVEYESFDPIKKIVTVKFKGACRSCPLLKVTLRSVVRQRICEMIPEVEDVIAR